MRDGFEEIMAQASPTVQELAWRTKALIEEVMPGVVEVPWPRQKTIRLWCGTEENVGALLLQTDAFLFHPADMEIPPTSNSADVYHILNARRGLPGEPLQL